MANAAGFIQESIWRDEHWRELSRTAQTLYLQLLSQKELDCAGVLPLQPNKWAKGCDELTIEQVWADLNELQENRFVYFDTDTDEAFVRTYMRNSNVARVPNMRKSAARAALLVGSSIIKPLLATELRALGYAECAEAADQIDPSGRVSEPFRNGSKLTLSKPLPEPTGVGVGVGLTHVGSSQVGEKPSEFCSKHPNGTERDCRACGQARVSYPERYKQWQAERRAERAAARAEAIAGCLRCDEYGDITFEDHVVKCDHKAGIHA